MNTLHQFTTSNVKAGKTHAAAAGFGYTVWSQACPKETPCDIEI
jgi:hypothetical protein